MFLSTLSLPNCYKHKHQRVHKVGGGNKEVQGQGHPKKAKEQDHVSNSRSDGNDLNDRHPFITWLCAISVCNDRHFFFFFFILRMSSAEGDMHCIGIQFN